MPTVPSRCSIQAALLVLLVAAGGMSRAAFAQCTTQWVPGAILGTNGSVLASTTWDPDGAGPANTLLVLGGTFTLAGTAVAANLVTWDPVADVWSSLGAGTNGSVTALAARPNGDLVAAGTFTTAGGVAANGIARWNGATWSALGSGVLSPGAAKAMSFLGNGDLVAGGSFTAIGGVAANRIARWDGTSWSAMGAGTNQAVNALAVSPNGDLFAGGSFTTVDGVSANSIARFDGASWSALGTGINPPGFVEELGTLPNGDVIAAGTFDTAGGVTVRNVARWNGASWSALGTWRAAPVQGLTVLPNGNAFVCHNNPPRVWHWDGTNWWTIGFATANFTSLTSLPNGDLIACGNFQHGVTRLSAGWSLLGRGWDDAVNASAVLPSGDVVVGGRFKTAAGAKVNSLARWDGTSWGPLSGGTQDGVNGVVNALLTLPDGRLLVGGQFNPVLPLGTPNIAIWDGASWAGLGGGVGGAVNSVNALAALPNGDIFAAGYFTSAGGVPADGIARWNGTSWSALGSGISGFQHVVRALATMPNGDLMVGGQFSHAGGAPANCIARWNGTSWSPLGLGMIDPVTHLLTTVDGNLIAAGTFNWAGTGPANRIARWDGSTWSPMGGGIVGTPAALAKLPNGDVIASAYTGVPGAQSGFLQRWDGTAWSILASGANAPIATMAMTPGGTLAVGGSFTTVGPIPGSYFAEIASTCPATATTFGAGCSGSGGTNVLTATSLPWVGSTFRATGTGLPTVSIVLTLTSVTPIAQGAVPLSLAFSQAGAGCDVLTMPDLLGFVVTTNGVAQSDLFLPNTSPLVGIPFYHQMVPIEVDTNGAWPSVVATNALQLVAGSF